MYINGQGSVKGVVNTLTGMTIYASSICVGSKFLIQKYKLSPRLEDIELVNIPLQLYMVSISIFILWYQNQAHQVILGEMMLHCLQFGIIINILLLDILVFGVAIIFVIATIVN